MADLVCLAKIIAAHGIRGEVKLKSFTADVKDFAAYGQLSNKDQTRFFEVKITGFAKELVRAKIKGVDTRNDAESLKGTELYISRDKLPALKKDTFYQTDLIGLKVLEKSSLKQIGEIVGVYNFGAGDILEIKPEGSKQTEMLPFTDEYVPTVDVEQGFVVVSSGTMNYQKDDEDEG